MKYATSGALSYSDRKDRHVCESMWWIETGIVSCAFKLVDPDGDVITKMDNYGRLHVYKGYIWDGSSGPTIDGVADPVPSLVHDVLYEAMRSGRLHASLRKAVDNLYYELLRERGMGRFRAGMRYYGLRIVGVWAASRLKGPEYPI